MSEILAYVDKLNELDTTDGRAHGAGRRVRHADARGRSHQPSRTPRRCSANAPAREDFFFKVPRIIE